MTFLSKLVKSEVSVKQFETEYYQNIKPEKISFKNIFGKIPEKYLRKK